METNFVVWATQNDGKILSVCYMGWVFPLNFIHLRKPNTDRLHLDICIYLESGSWKRD